MTLKEWRFYTDDINHSNALLTPYRLV